MEVSGCDDEAEEPGDGSALPPDDAAHLHGWLPPEDRLWRHPSELRSSGTGKSTAPRDLQASPFSVLGRHRLFTAGTVVASIAMLALVTGLILADRGATSAGTATVTPTASASKVVASTMSTETTPCCGSTPVSIGGNLLKLVDSIKPALLALVVRHGTTVNAESAVVIGSGLAVTTAHALSGTSSVIVESSSGQQFPARVIGVDAGSNLAVLRVPSDLPSVPMDGNTGNTLAPGQLAAAVTTRPGPSDGAATSTAIAVGMVWSADDLANADAVTSKLSSVEVDTPLTTADDGSALVGSDGTVDGIMDTQGQAGGQPVSVFLPMSLVCGVANQLASDGTVHHGWLGVDASDAMPTAATEGTGQLWQPVDAGAVIDSVDPRSAAAKAGLRPGDVIDGMNGQAVRSLADLWTTLYVTPPGTTVPVTVDRAESQLTVWATLGSSG